MPSGSGSKRSKLKASWTSASPKARVSYTPIVERAAADLRAEAARHREDFGNESTARTLEWAADKVEAALRDAGDELLSLEEAFERSGYSQQHLCRMIKEGQIPDLRPPGSRGRILIRACDLPIKPNKPHIPDADEHGLASRLLRAKEA